MDYVVVTGPPCSGKSTWIAANSGGADVFARDGLDNDPSEVARDRSAFVLAHAGRDGTCYIESCRMPSLDVGRGDRVVHVPMDADERTCLERLEASGRSDKARWRDVIRSHFSESGPARGLFHVETSPHGDEWAARPGKRGRMADETVNPETVETQPKAAEPQGAETDWKAEARKWEQRAKDNKRDLDAVQKALDGYEAKKRDDEEREKTAAEALENAKAEIKRLQAEAERDRLAREVAKAQGVDPDVLVLMRGDSKDEIEANAKLLAQSSKARWPEVRDKGPQKVPGKSKDEILAIKDQAERVQAIARNLDKFK